jgi:hypothetical protein
METGAVKAMRETIFLSAPTALQLKGQAVILAKGEARPTIG